MRFTVVWRPKALADVAQFWNVGPDRNAITIAADNIDSKLATGPSAGAGIVKVANYYVLRMYPLGVDYEIAEPDRKVIVNSVWRLTDLPQN